MNDFTKDELQTLRACVNTTAYQSLRAPFDLEPELCGLRNKIQSMIENYCEHEYSESLVKFSDEWSRACFKCGRKK